MGQTGGSTGGGPDTPWTVDHDAAGFNLANLHRLGSKLTGSLPTFINVLANLTVAFNPSTSGSDLMGIVLITAAAGFAGAAVNTTLFEVQYSSTRSIQGFAFINALDNAPASGGLQSRFGSVALGFGSFKVVATVAVPAGAATYNFGYWSPGN